MSKASEHLLSLEHNHTIYSESIGNPKRVYLLLHGYLLDGKYMIDELRETLGDDCLIVAPNGPFLVPVKKNERYKAKYAWYFFDPVEKTYYVNYDPGAKYLNEVLNIYNKDSLPVTVIGYSQGGYLAPRVANFCKDVDRVISIASVLRPKLFDVEKDVDYFQINSKGDLVVDFQDAVESGEEMKTLGARYVLKALEDSGHRIDEVYKETLRTLL